MRITSELAHPIILRLKALLDYNINIMDEEGLIVASTDPNRMYQIHEGALKVIKTEEQIVIYPVDESLYLGSKPGVNLPVKRQDQIVGVIGVTGHPDEVMKFAAILKVTVEVMLQEMELLSKLHYENKIMENWVLDLVHPYEFNYAKLEADGKHYLDLNFEEEISVFLIRFPDLNSRNVSGNNSVPLKKDQRLNQIRALIPKISFSAFLDDEHCLIGIPHMKENYPSVARSIKGYFTSHKLTIQIAIGHAYRGINGYRKSYLEASDSLGLLDKFPNDDQIAHISEWGFVNLLQQVPKDRLESFHEQYLGGKQGLNEEQLETLKALFDHDLNMKHTAEALHIHRNTLLYRLCNIDKQTGLDPKSFHDSMILRILMVVQKITDN
ncbi:MAG: CdaR family transcriptional regulator [Bacillota bacterium]